MTMKYARVFVSLTLLMISIALFLGVVRFNRRTTDIKNRLIELETVCVDTKQKLTLCQSALDRGTHPRDTNLLVVTDDLGVSSIQFYDIYCRREDKKAYCSRVQGL